MNEPIYAVRNLGMWVVWMRGVRICSAYTQIESMAAIAAIRSMDTGRVPSQDERKKISAAAIAACIAAKSKVG